jgi:hypothetical protein
VGNTDFGQLNSDFASRLQAFINASGGRVWLESGYRDEARQAELWEAALRKYGDPEIADNWVARPGESNHGKRIAGDLGYADDAARNWAHQNAGIYGLHFPMEWEPWHIEPIGSFEMGGRGAYTTPPAGFVNPWDANQEGMTPRGEVEDPYDAGVQMRRMIQIIRAGPEAATSMMATPSTEGLVSTPAGPGGTAEPEAQAAALVQQAQPEPQGVV